MTHFNTLLIIRKGLKINIIKASKDSILTMTENMECKGFRIGPIRKELLLNIYHHTY